MLHDIFPKKLNNQFKYIKPDADSRCIAFNSNHILVGDSDGSGIRYPRYEEIQFEVMRSVFLFSVDDVKYFLVDVNADAVLGCEYIPMVQFRAMKPKEEVFAGMTAYHLYVWYRDNTFCGRCGGKTKHGDKERVLICEECGHLIYPKIMPAVIVGVINGDKILVTRYKDRPYRGYALIAGFTEIGETAEETVAREVMEETGVKVKDITYYKTQPWGIAQDLLLGFYCHLDGDDTITIDEDELAIAEWVSRDELEVTYEDVSMTNEMICRFKEGLV